MPARCPAVAHTRSGQLLGLSLWADTGYVCVRMQCQSVIQHVRASGELPPLEMMHASDALARKKKEDASARAEGRLMPGDTDEEAIGGDGEGARSFGSDFALAIAPSLASFPRRVAECQHWELWELLP